MNIAFTPCRRVAKPAVGVDRSAGLYGKGIRLSAEAYGIRFIRCESRPIPSASPFPAMVFNDFLCLQASDTFLPKAPRWVSSASTSSGQPSPPVGSTRRSLRSESRPSCSCPIHVRAASRGHWHRCFDPSPNRWRGTSPPGSCVAWVLNDASRRHRRLVVKGLTLHEQWPDGPRREGAPRSADS